MKTVALNMIVGPNEAMELDRVLSQAADMFDEVVINCTTNDEKVREVASKYADMVISSPWTNDRYPHGDFAYARNLALDNTKSDYVHWLDADDIVDDQYKMAFTGKIKAAIASGELKHDIILIRYAISYDQFGNPAELMLVPRIFKNDPRIKWKYPCHEQIKMDAYSCKMATFNGLSIKHAPCKPAALGVNRNLAILRHEMQMDPCAHVRFYYAKELLTAHANEPNSEYRAEAVALLKDVVERREGLKPNLAQTCCDIASLALYARNDKQNLAVNKAGLQEAETYANIATSFSDLLAEPYVTLGDICMSRGDLDSASTMFRKALTKKVEDALSADSSFYEELPARRLMAISLKKGELERALWYSKLVTAHCPDDALIMEGRKHILKELSKNG